MVMRNHVVCFVDFNMCTFRILVPSTPMETLIKAKHVENAHEGAPNIKQRISSIIFVADNRKEYTAIRS